VDNTNWIAVTYKPSELLPLFSSPYFDQLAPPGISRLASFYPELPSRQSLYDSSLFIRSPVIRPLEGTAQILDTINTTGSESNHRAAGICPEVAKFETVDVTRWSPIDAGRVFLTMVWVVQG
jgi:hypothetical protein